VDEKRFDQITRALTGSSDRREAIKTILGTGVAGALGAFGLAEAAAKTSQKKGKANKGKANKSKQSAHNKQKIHAQDQCSATDPNTCRQIGHPCEGQQATCCCATDLSSCIKGSGNGASHRCCASGDQSCGPDPCCASDEECCGDPSNPTGCAKKGHCPTCTSECSGDTPTCCGTTCVDLETDEANCGECGNQCQSEETCSNGLCCPNGQTNCNGTCITSDQCCADQDCTAGGECQSGTCDSSTNTCSYTNEPDNTSCNLSSTDSKGKRRKGKATHAQGATGVCCNGVCTDETTCPCINPQTCDNENPCCANFDCDNSGKCVATCTNPQTCDNQNHCCAGFDCDNSGKCVATCAAEGHPCVGQGNVCCDGLICGPAPNPGHDLRCCDPTKDPINCVPICTPESCDAKQCLVCSPEGVCVPKCPLGQQCDNNGNCVPTPCTPDNCNPDNCLTCTPSGQCVSTCTGGTTCNGQGQCTGGGGGGGGGGGCTAAICNPSMCLTCNANGQCVSLCPFGQTCAPSGICVTLPTGCQTDADCGLGGICTNGICFVTSTCPAGESNLQCCYNAVKKACRHRGGTQPGHGGGGHKCRVRGKKRCRQNFQNT